MTQRYLDPVIYSDEPIYPGEYFETSEFSMYLAAEGRSYSFASRQFITLELNGGQSGRCHAWKFRQAENLDVPPFFIQGSSIGFRFDDDIQTWFLSFRIKIPQYPTENRAVVSFVEDNVFIDPNICLMVGNDGKLRIMRGFVILSTSTYTVPTNEYIHVECKIYTDSANGTFEVRINESTKIIYSGNTSFTGNQFTKYIQFGILGAGINTIPDMLIHDVAIRDGNDNEDWWGDTPILALLPSDDGDIINFIGSDGDSLANYAIVSNNPHNPSEYVQTGANNAIDLYELPDLEYVEILGVQDMLMGMADQCFIKFYHLIKTGGVLYQNIVFDVTAGLKYYSRAYQDSPSTGDDWTLSEFNRSQIGQKSLIQSSLSGFVFYDFNGNGVYEPPDDFPFEVEMQLYLDNGDNVFDPNTDTLISEVISDIYGYYGFSGLTPGAVYWVYFPNILSYDPTTPNPIGPITATTECITVADLGVRDPPG